MQYADLRDKIQSGDIIAFADDGGISNFIRWWTKEDYSHVAIAWHYGRHVMLIEAHLKTGVAIRPLSKALLDSDIVHHYTQPQSYWSDNVEDYALKQWGDTYDLPECVLAGLDEPPEMHSHKFQCAALCWAVMRYGNVPLQMSRATPGTFIKSIVALGSVCTPIDG